MSKKLEITIRMGNIGTMLRQVCSFYLDNDINHPTWFRNIMWESINVNIKAISLYLGAIELMWRRIMQHTDEVKKDYEENYNK